MGFDIKLPAGKEEQLRKAFRTKVPGLTVRFEDQDRVLDVKDLSATGFAVLDPEKRFEEGAHIECDLLINNKLFLSGATAKVIRVLDNGIVGINFVELNLKQQAKLDKLVLEVQKRLIALRKKQREQE
ncbi:Type IV pilus assembly PilZ [Pseudodesulfovibrio profundus]|uniref:Type IV pilus assembly PilZ n=1 Tax=Pseudodesulfovibrio profundus TaxID=57320 RepID=A0A2C8F6E3_9BACT|nr:PilZ domain-containing protein [Pseudodesulfovibrio profundus]MBC18596.1 pilus assembly protein PilZ [Desulfovibrio sp.]SOB57947.1 Type IV pilus assembly PilZ [Pseudodesulfovibrio profundus]|tara:strand:- start:6471 stop:6854 length:384 start_codon:yes stop_codon:yes gene_type:complete